PRCRGAVGGRRAAGARAARPTRHVRDRARPGRRRRTPAGPGVLGTEGAVLPPDRERRRGPRRGSGGGPMTAVAARSETRPAARAGAWVVYRWELIKLTRQVKAQVVVGLCLLAPFLFVAALNVQSNTPQDTLFGRWVHDSGFSIPLVVLGFAGQW